MGNFSHICLNRLCVTIALHGKMADRRITEQNTYQFGTPLFIFFQSFLLRRKYTFMKKGFMKNIFNQMQIQFRGNL